MSVDDNSLIVDKTIIDINKIKIHLNSKDFREHELLRVLIYYNYKCHLTFLDGSYESEYLKNYCDCCKSHRKWRTMSKVPSQNHI